MLHGHRPIGRQGRRILVGLCLISLLFALLPILSGCMTMTHDFDDVDPDKPAAISFIDISGEENRNADTVRATEPYFILPSKQYKDFLSDLDDLQFSDTVPIFMPSDPSFSYGNYVVHDLSGRHLSVQLLWWLYAEL